MNVSIGDLYPRSSAPAQIHVMVATSPYEVLHPLVEVGGIPVQHHAPHIPTITYVGQDVSEPLDDMLHTIAPLFSKLYKNHGVRTYKTVRYIHTLE